MATKANRRECKAKQFHVLKQQGNTKGKARERSKKGQRAKVAGPLIKLMFLAVTLAGGSLHRKVSLAETESGRAPHKVDVFGCDTCWWQL